MALKRIETSNAVYLIEFESPHERSDDEVLSRNVDAYSFEHLGVGFESDLVSGWVNQNRFAGNRRPPIFLVDVPIEEGHEKSLARRVRGAWVLRALAAGVALSGPAKKLYRVAAKKIRKSALTETQSEKKGSRAKEKLSPRAAGRRSILKGMLAAGALGIADAISPDLLRVVPQTRRFAETLDVAHHDFIRAGRNAVLAERLDSVVAPHLARQLGRKPVIGVVLGTAHKGFEVQLKDPQFRRQTLNAFSLDIQRLKWHSGEFIDTYYFDAKKGRYVPRQMRVPPLVPKQESKPKPQVRLTRRGFGKELAKLALRRRRVR